MNKCHHTFNEKCFADNMTFVLNFEANVLKHFTLSKTTTTKIILRLKSTKIYETNE